MTPGPLLLAVCATLAPAQHAAQSGGFQARVDRAIDRGCDWMLANLRRMPPDQGASFLAALALVKSGVSLHEPGLAEVIESARTRPVPAQSGTYSAGLQLMLLESAGMAASEPNARKVMDYLTDHQQANGLWGYPEGTPDLSNTQFALLGLHAAHVMGLEVSDEALRRAAHGIFRAQDGKPGFPYQVGGGPTASMTVSTLGGLAILAGMSSAGSKLDAELQRFRPDQERAAQAFEETWRRPQGVTLPSVGNYYLYALERYGDLSGVTSFAGRDWYEEGAEYLMLSQDARGSWGDTVNTSFALLFLKRASLAPSLAITGVDEGAAPQGPAPQARVPYLASWLFAAPLPLDQELDAKSLVLREDGPALGAVWRRVQLAADAPAVLRDLRGGDSSPAALLFGTLVRYAAPPAPAGVEPWPAVEITAWVEAIEDWSLWLDGELITRRPRQRHSAQDPVVLTLSPGEHVLVLRLEHRLAAARFGLRLTDSEGGELPPMLSASANIPPRVRGRTGTLGSARPAHERR